MLEASHTQVIYTGAQKACSAASHAAGRHLEQLILDHTKPF